MAEENGQQDSTISVTFVSEKINKIRWKPVEYRLKTPDVFASGSWDNQENHIAIWKVPRQDPMEEPQKLCELNHAGDVTDMKFIDVNSLISSSSNGSVMLCNYSETSQTLETVDKWEEVHARPCTGLATSSPDIVSVGEDGKLCILRPETKQPTRIIEADSFTLNAVEYLTQHQVITANAIGQLKVWDFRQKSSQPSSTFSIAGEKVGLTTGLNCVDKHPNQPHIVAAGGNDGTLSIWDMRKENYPVSLLEAHKAYIWEVKFHPSSPDNLFSCSEDGSVWHWDCSTNLDSAAYMQTLIGSTSSVQTDIDRKTRPAATGSEGDGWLSEISQNRMKITSLLAQNYLPINSMDVCSNQLVCGSDGEAIYHVGDLVIR